MNRLHVIIGAIATVAMAGGATLGDVDPVLTLDDGRQLPAWAATETDRARVESVAPGVGILKLLLALLAVAGSASLIVLASYVEDTESVAAEAAAEAQELERQRRALYREKELEMSVVLAEEHATRKFADAQGIPVQALYDVEATPVEAAQQPTNDSGGRAGGGTFGDRQDVADHYAELRWKPQQTDQPAQPAGPPRCKALDGAVHSPRSTMLVGGTGSGKSTSQAYWFYQFNQHYPDAEVWVLSQKNDSFYGLREAGRVTLFNSENLIAVRDLIMRVHSILCDRRHATEDEREQFADAPVRLVLADWASISEALDFDQSLKAKIKQKLAEIVTVGREFNVGLFVDTQSYNVKSLGLGDSNTRVNLNILAQGYSWIDEYGNTQGDYMVLEKLLKDANIVSSDRAEDLRLEFARLKGESQRQGQPVIFSSIGGGQIQLAGDLRGYKRDAAKLSLR